MAQFIEQFKVAIAVAAFGLSLASFVISMRSSARARKAEAITHLLGAKENVAFAALKVLRDGLPASERDRNLLVAALVQASVFTSSDRARALLYRVVEINRTQFRGDFMTAARSLSDTFDSMQKYQFDDGDLDLARGRRRLASLFKVIESP